MKLLISGIVVEINKLIKIAHINSYMNELIISRTEKGHFVVAEKLDNGQSQVLSIKNHSETIEFLQNENMWTDDEASITNLLNEGLISNEI